MAYDVGAVTAYIRQAAAKRGIDPDTAVRVARSEGLANGVWQSNIIGPNGQREPSYGPFQLYTGGGLGNRFVKQTGLDPRDPSTVYAQVDFALDNAATGGWSPWYGAAKVGVGNWDGLRGAKPAGVSGRMGLKQSDMPPPSLSGIGSPSAPSYESTGSTGSYAGTPMSGIPSMTAAEAADMAALLQKGKPRRGNPFEGIDFNLAEAPRIQGGGGDARSTGNMLLEALNAPTAADMLLKKRLQGIR